MIIRELDNSLFTSTPSHLFRSLRRSDFNNCLPPKALTPPSQKTHDLAQRRRFYRSQFTYYLTDYLSVNALTSEGRLTDTYQYITIGYSINLLHFKSLRETEVAYLLPSIA